MWIQSRWDGNKLHDGNDEWQRSYSPRRARQMLAFFARARVCVCLCLCVWHSSIFLPWPLFLLLFGRIVVVARFQRWHFSNISFSRFIVWCVQRSVAFSIETGLSPVDLRPTLRAGALFWFGVREVYDATNKTQFIVKSGQIDPLANQSAPTISATFHLSYNSNSQDLLQDVCLCMLSLNWGALSSTNSRRWMHIVLNRILWHLSMEFTLFARFVSVLMLRAHTARWHLLYHPMPIYFQLKSVSVSVCTDI